MIENDERDTSQLVRKRAQIILLERVLITLGTFALGLMLVLLLFSTWQGHQARQELLDCTIPGGECHERGQKQTERAIRDIVRLGTVSSYCANRPGNVTIAEVDRCVERILKASK